VAGLWTGDGESANANRTAVFSSPVSALAWIDLNTDSVDSRGPVLEGLSEAYFS
jgi:hypothetical protein